MVTLHLLLVDLLLACIHILAVSLLFYSPGKPHGDLRFRLSLALHVDTSVFFLLDAVLMWQDGESTRESRRELVRLKLERLGTVKSRFIHRLFFILYMFTYWSYARTSCDSSYQIRDEQSVYRDYIP